MRETRRGQWISVRIQATKLKMQLDIVLVSTTLIVC